MVDVFISYSRRDQATVAMLARAIRDEGYDLWWDEELPPHRSYGDVITDKIASAKAAVVVWSADSVQSEWVRAEADMARNQRKLIQTALDEIMPPLPFNQIQFAELGNWQGEADHPGWRKVKVSLAELCGAREGARDRDGGREPAYSPPRQSQHSAPAASSSNWPLFAGGGIALAGIAIAAGVMLSGGGAEKQAFAAEEVPAALASPADAGVVVEPGSAPFDSHSADASPASVPAAPGVEVVDAPAADPEAIPINPADMTFADSSTRLLTQSEIAGFGPATLRVARNEIYARKGRRFRDQWLRDYFSQYAWYRPRFDEVELNPVEKRNVALIQQAEARYR